MGEIIKGGREKWADMETIMGRGAGEGLCMGVPVKREEEEEGE